MLQKKHFQGVVVPSNYSPPLFCLSNPILIKARETDTGKINSMQIKYHKHTHTQNPHQIS